MRVRDHGPVEVSVWSDVAERCPYATYFHSPAWATLMVESFPELRIATRLFELGDGTPVVLPALAQRDGRSLDRLVSMVPGVYGGPIASRGLERREVEAIASRASTSGVSYLRIFGNPFLAAFRTEPTAKTPFTQVIECKDGFDATFARFHRNHRRSYRSAVDQGLQVDRARSLEDFGEYYRVYRADRERWGERAATDHSFRLFEVIHSLGDPGIVLWLARYQGRVVGGDLWLYWNRHNVGWHGAAEPSEFKRFPTNFLITEIVRDACGRGAPFVDLNPSGGHEGVVRFKDSFGARRLHFRHGDRTGGWLSWIRGQFGGLAR